MCSASVVLATLTSLPVPSVRYRAFAPEETSLAAARLRAALHALPPSVYNVLDDTVSGADYRSYHLQSHFTVFLPLPHVFLI